jgi:hypothetical protein
LFQNVVSFLLKVSITVFNSNGQSTSSAGTGSDRIPGALVNVEAHDDAIVCSCNVDAILLTVRKEGPNKGLFNDDIVSPPPTMHASLYVLKDKPAE